MTEPWEIMKMALCEAGRPDIAAIIRPPGADWANFATMYGWLDVASDAELQLILKARSVILGRPGPECLDCWRARSGSPGPPTCTHT